MVKALAWVGSGDAALAFSFMTQGEQVLIPNLSRSAEDAPHVNSINGRKIRSYQGLVVLLLKSCALRTSYSKNLLDWTATKATEATKGRRLGDFCRFGPLVGGRVPPRPRAQKKTVSYR